MSNIKITSWIQINIIKSINLNKKLFNLLKPLILKALIKKDCMIPLIILLNNKFLEI
jgi:hypothetical protein